MPVYSVKKPPVSSCSARRGRRRVVRLGHRGDHEDHEATIAGNQYQSPLKID
jgi:hypothetical protein